jgi:hypothetical protein
MQTGKHESRQTQAGLQAGEELFVIFTVKYIFLRLKSQPRTTCSWCPLYLSRRSWPTKIPGKRSTLAVLLNTHSFHKEIKLGDLYSHCHFIRFYEHRASDHGLNIELDLQSFFGLQVHSCNHWLRPRIHPCPPPPAFGLIFEGAIGQPR